MNARQQKKRSSRNGFPTFRAYKDRLKLVNNIIRTLPYDKIYHFILDYGADKFRVDSDWVIETMLMNPAIVSITYSNIEHDEYHIRCIGRDSATNFMILIDPSKVIGGRDFSEQTTEEEAR